MLTRYPHQLSGGMRQRVMIAMALSCRPSAPDRRRADHRARRHRAGADPRAHPHPAGRDEHGGAVHHARHGRGRRSRRPRGRHARRPQGRGGQRRTGSFTRRSEPYTRALLAAVPRLGAMRGTDLPRKISARGSARRRRGGRETSPLEPRCRRPSAQRPLLEVRDLTTRFDVKAGLFGRVSRRVHAVEQRELRSRSGRDAGAGRRIRLRQVDDRPLAAAPRRCRPAAASSSKVATSRGCRASEVRPVRRDIQMIFQDPFASLDPRLTVGFSIAEPLYVHGVAQGTRSRGRASRGCSGTSVSPPIMRSAIRTNSRAASASGSLSPARSRSIRRSSSPTRPSRRSTCRSRRRSSTSCIDLQDELGLSYLFISHDMAVVERVSHRVAVMYLGQIVEIGPRRAVFENPQHPYTRKLHGRGPGRRPRATPPPNGVIIGRDPEPDPRRRRRAGASRRSQEVAPDILSPRTASPDAY